ncbi:hypothetical protein [Synoicihabitans lomoniglobus]|uniref:hypothetical protein n=1 Tax=Synoicihabitans lomoniglobus TaxID=2909285 RepID=UPI002ED29837|nr:hypothetical protein [Opitutaceae bacterium LMO-M01]
MKTTTNDSSDMNPPLVAVDTRRRACVARRSCYGVSGPPLRVTQPAKTNPEEVRNVLRPTPSGSAADGFDPMVDIPLEIQNA